MPMKIRITDIPPGGLEQEFELDLGALNTRVAGLSEGKKRREISGPEYVFSEPPKAKLFVEQEGGTVFLRGECSGEFRTVCSRCAEEVVKELDVPIEMVLKPASQRGVVGANDEDLEIGFYTNDEIDCGSVVEEFVMLGVPYSVVCTEGCKGLCPKCGSNLNSTQCGCTIESENMSPFAVLKQMKLH